MSVPFAPGSWAARPSILLPANMTVREGFLDPLTGLLYATGNSTKDSNPEPGRQYSAGVQWVLSDSSEQWTTLVDTFQDSLGPVDVERGSFWNTFSLGGNVFRFRTTYTSAVNASDGTVYPGNVWLEQAVQGRAPVQAFLGWNQLNKGLTGHASFWFAAGGPVLIPKSGPQGQDADWLFIACKLLSPPSDVLVNTVSMWRSTDFGFSWAMVRELKNTQGFGDGSNGLEFFVRNPGTGRLLVEQSGGLLLVSDDNGVTWTRSPTPALGPLTSPTLHPGNTWHAFQVPGLTSTGVNLVSCDDGLNWADPNPDLVIPASTRGSGVKLGPQEILFVHQKTALPGDGSTVWWSDSGGEKFLSAGDIAVLPDSAVYMGLTPAGYPVVVGKLGRAATSTDRARGSFTKRTFCSLASAKLAAAKPLAVCGAPIVAKGCD